MKKIVIGLLIALMVVTLVACGKTKETVSTDSSKSSKQAVSTSTPTPTKASTVNKTVSRNRLGELVEFFKTNGFTVGEKTEKMAAIIGARAGFGIQLNGKNVEVYEYDPDSKDELSVNNLETAKDGYIDMSGFTLKCVLNGNLILAGYDEHPDKDKIVETFGNFK